MLLPSISLEATPGGQINLSKLPGLTILFCYPRTGVPGGNPDIAAWDAIPGARGCTPQACSFRDHYGELMNDFNARIFGLSTQTPSTQYEAATRLHLPFPLISDSKFAFTKALQLPTFVYDNLTLIKRNTLIIQDGKIIKVFYPVFPPNENARMVMDYLRELKG
jgi:peroxiredoxin